MSQYKNLPLSPFVSLWETPSAMAAEWYVALDIHDIQIADLQYL